MLIEEWALLPQEMLHQLVLRMRRQCEATIASAMSWRSRLAILLRLCSVGWMEMGLSQTDDAIRLNVHRVGFNDSSININPKILHPEDLFKPDHERQH
ncbi:hypothetical protein TNCV_4803891 [Trichonephila clavipes]|nr:hypothetical protein TNCV_4803891 [Trichonephila clavipes]